MSTGYHLLKANLINLKMQDFPEHTRITLWDRQGAHIGELTVRTTGEHGGEDLSNLLRSFFENTPCYFSTGGQDPETKYVLPAENQGRYEKFKGKVVLSEYLELLPPVPGEQMAIPA